MPLPKTTLAHRVQSPDASLGFISQPRASQSTLQSNHLAGHMHRATVSSTTLSFSPQNPRRNRRTTYFGRGICQEETDQEFRMKALGTVINNINRSLRLKSLLPAFHEIYFFSELRNYSLQRLLKLMVLIKSIRRRYKIDAIMELRRNIMPMNELNQMSKQKTQKKLCNALEKIFGQYESAYKLVFFDNTLTFTKCSIHQISLFFEKITSFIVGYERSCMRRFFGHFKQFFKGQRCRGVSSLCGIIKSKEHALYAYTMNRIITKGGLQEVEACKSKISNINLERYTEGKNKHKSIANCRLKIYDIKIQIENNKKIMEKMVSHNKTSIIMQEAQCANRAKFLAKELDSLQEQFENASNDKSELRRQVRKRKLRLVTKEGLSKLYQVIESSQKKALASNQLSKYISAIQLESHTFLYEEEYKKLKKRIENIQEGYCMGDHVEIIHNKLLDIVSACLKWNCLLKSQEDWDSQKKEFGILVDETIIELQHREHNDANQ